jgi:hypothetical protein
MGDIKYANGGAAARATFVEASAVASWALSTTSGR